MPEIVLQDLRKGGVGEEKQESQYAINGGW
jgi:hypothetical protein